MIIKELKTIRRKAKLSQAEVAAYLGITKQQYFNYEKEGAVPERHVQKLSELFDINFGPMHIFNRLNFKLLRILVDMSQKDIAEALGLTQQFIFQLENGRAGDFDKYEDKLLMFFRNLSRKKTVLPFNYYKVPGATILTFLDIVYILVDNEKKFEPDAIMFNDKMKIMYFYKRS